MTVYVRRCISVSDSSEPGTRRGGLPKTSLCRTSEMPDAPTQESVAWRGGVGRVFGRTHWDIRLRAMAGVVVAVDETKLQILSRKFLGQRWEGRRICDACPASALERRVGRRAGELHAGDGAVLHNRELDTDGSAFANGRKNRRRKTRVPILGHDRHDPLEIRIEVHAHRVTQNMHAALCAGTGRRFLGL